ncbi:VOC family protein [Nocardia sp. NPDC005366]|uniref:VOC family protein n=1 Tax=Nocardia sp. NPDC005366 TaxID=3156878 RepID=UPI0033BB3DE4
MSIAGGPIFQLGWVVPDIASATAEFAERYGVDGWFTIPEVRFGPPTCRYRGCPAEYTSAVALGYAGGQQLELIEPRSGDSPYSDHLTRFGAGLHHIAYVPDDFDAALAGARAAGVEIVAEGGFEEFGMEFAYLDGGSIGTCVELMRLSARMKAVFDRLVPEGHANPWT